MFELCPITYAIIEVHSWFLFETYAFMKKQGVLYFLESFIPKYYYYSINYI